MSYETIKAQNAFLQLPEEDRIFLRDVKHHVEANKIQIGRILTSQHPASIALYDWVSASQERKKWYLKHINHIRILPDGIFINGKVYDFEDTLPVELLSGGEKKVSSKTPLLSGLTDRFLSKKVMENPSLLRWERKGLLRYTKRVEKEIPDWEGLIDFFPRGEWQSFCEEVLKMSGKYLGNSKQTLYASKNVIVLGGVQEGQGKARLAQKSHFII